MRKRILEYRREIDAILAQDAGRDWRALRDEHLIQISFFQHERLIHLAVTGLFALIGIIAAALTVLAFSPVVLALLLAVLVLLIPYIGHYYLLENEVQKLYEQYDRIQKKCEESRIITAG